MDAKQLAAVLHRIEQRLDGKDYQTVERLAESYAYLTELVADKDTTIETLRNLLKPRSEKTSAVLGDKGEPSTDKNTDTNNGKNNGSADKGESGDPSGDDEEPPPKPGHGRNGVNDFPGADRVNVLHDQLQAGDACPNCDAGIVYPMTPGVLLRITGQAPLQATVYELQKLRCSLCGEVFTAKSPAEAGERKYDAQAACSSMEQGCHSTGWPGCNGDLASRCRPPPNGRLFANWQSRLVPSTWRLFARRLSPRCCTLTTRPCGFLN